MAEELTVVLTPLIHDPGCFSEGFQGEHGPSMSGQGNEGNSRQKQSHSCFNRYQRERLVPGKRLLFLVFITWECCEVSRTQM